MGKLENRVAIVTGGARGIGAGIVKKLSEEGAHVAVLDWKLGTDAERIVEEARERAGWAEAYEVDVSDSLRVDESVQAIAAAKGTIDILVNDAGICPFADLLSITDELWMKTINVNLSGTFYMCRAVAPYMIAQQSGSIVNISTISTYIGTPHQIHYIASKSGVNGLTRSLAVALAPYKIRVNTVAPGGVYTNINKNVQEQEEAWARSGVPKRMRGWLPMERMGIPEDIANGVLYLVSDDASYVTGAFLPIDGGALII